MNKCLGMRCDHDVRKYMYVLKVELINGRSKKNSEIYIL